MIVMRWFLISLLFVCLFIGWWFGWLIGWLVKLDIVLRWESTYCFVEMVCFVCDEELVLHIIMFEWTFMNYSFIEWIRSLNSLVVIKNLLYSFFLCSFWYLNRLFISVKYFFTGTKSSSKNARAWWWAKWEKKMFILFN